MDNLYYENDKTIVINISQNNVFDFSNIKQ